MGFYFRLVPVRRYICVVRRCPVAVCWSFEPELLYPQCEIHYRHKLELKCLKDLVFDEMGGNKSFRFVVLCELNAYDRELLIQRCLTSETVKGLSLTLEGIDDVHGGDGLAASVFSVGDRVSDDVLKEDLEDTTGLFVDQSGDTLDTTTTSETTDGGLGNTLDVITKNLSVTLGASLAETLSSLSSSGHVD